MDTSPKYIEMCEAAGEVQALWKPAWGDWIADKGMSEDGACVMMTVRFKASGFLDAKDKSDLVWIPRQDQLQAMMVGASLFSWTTLALFESYCREFQMDSEFAFISGHYSWEMLWLAFVMNQKYYKKWNGQEWITK